MKEHIKNAEYTFNYIFKKIDEIRQGNLIFDDSFLQSINTLETNREIHESLIILLKYIEKFGDKTSEKLNIIRVINSVLNKSSEIKKEPIKTTFGDIQDCDYEDVAKVCLDILQRLRLTYPKEVFETLIQLSIDENEKIKKKSLDIVSEMTKYTFCPKEKKVYCDFQFFVLDKIKELNCKHPSTYLNLIIQVSSALLSPFFENMSRSGYKTFTVHRGLLPVGEEVRKIRKMTIDILQILYSTSDRVSEKQHIVQTLKKATYIPRKRCCKPGFEKIILENVDTLISYYLFIIKEADNEIISIIEEQLNLLEKRFEKRGFKNIKKCISLIEKNLEYKMYKVLVDDDYSFWSSSDYCKDKKNRKQKIADYIKQITEKNFLQYQNMILSVTKNYEQLEDCGQFQYLYIFLNDLAKQKPKIAQKLILKNEKELNSLLIHLIAGMWQSQERIKAKNILENWIKNAKHLPVCACIFEYVGNIDEPLLNKVFKKAKQQNDVNALINVIRSIVSNFEENKIGKNLFVDSVNELKKQKNYYWHNYIWPGCKGMSILEVLNKEDLKIVLDSLLITPKIDYLLEKILSIFAQSSSKELIGFFYKRVIQSKKTLEEKYEAIPLDLDELREQLSKNAEIVIEEIFKWFEEKDGALSWKGRHFLQAIFPTFHQELEKKLIELIQSNDKNKVGIVLCILHSYEGEEFLHNVCKELIKQHPKKKKYKQEIFIILSQTGIVSGDFGFIEEYRRKEQEIQPWKKDESEVIKSFAEQYEKYLSKMINNEDKSVEENTKMRKMEHMDTF